MSQKKLLVNNSTGDQKKEKFVQWKEKKVLLNNLQKQAVTTIDGPVMIVAGPGTGKTTVLTQRIAYILKNTDVKPSSILSITFTEAGVVSMQQKLLKTIGTDAYKVNISTIHGFCNNVIQDHSEYFMEMHDFLPLNDLEKIQVLRSIIDQHKLPTLKPFRAPYYYIYDLPKAISNLKREGIDPEGLKKSIIGEEEKLTTIRQFTRNKTLTAEYIKQDNKIKRLHDLVVFYKAYQTELQTRQRYDYDDMILNVLQQLKKGTNLKAELQEKYQYFMVDEYQDTNNAQNELVFQLVDYWREQANLFVVGDDAQSIYRFQGASVENFYSFHHKFKNASIITLKQNYRSHQIILDASYALLQHNNSSLESLIPQIDKQLEAQRNLPVQELNKGEFTSGTIESYYVADQLKKLYKQDTPWEKMAVLVRQHRDVNEVIDMLTRFNIPYVRPAGDNVLDNKYVRQIIDLLRLITQLATAPSDDTLLFTVMNYKFLQIPYLDVLKISRLATNQKQNIWEAVVNNKTITLPEVELSPKGIEKIENFIEKLNQWQGESHNQTVAKLFEMIINKSGALDYILNLSTKFEHINSLNSFFAEIKSLNNGQPDLTLVEFVNNLDLMQEYRISIKEKDLGLHKGGVNILTAHGAKGLEFDHVFIPRSVDGNWGNRRNRELIKLPDDIIAFQELDKKEKNEDERRLFYVAMTRAKQSLTITYATSYQDQLGKEKKTIPTQFINEIPDEYWQEIITDEYTNSIQGHLEKLLQSTTPSKVAINKIKQEDFLRAILHRFKLSPTSLNSYLSCPYRFLLNNVLRTPRVMQMPMVYGTAFHKALEDYWQYYLEHNEYMADRLVLKSFNNSIHRNLLSPTDQNRALRQGAERVPKYLENYRGKQKKPLLLEYNCGMRNLLLRGSRLTGKIDKIEMLDDNKKYLNLVDYKTGKSVSNNQLLGLDKEAKTSFTSGQRNFNQLLFYKVMVDLDPWFMSQGYTAITGTLDFVEPTNDKYVQRTIEYKLSDINEMKEKIVDTWQKIMKFDFTRTENLNHCQWCPWTVHCGR